MSDRTDSRRLLDPDTLRRLCRARDLIAARSVEPLPLEAAAAAAHLSPFHFQRLFSRAFGESPHRFQTRRRLDLAKQLLAKDHLSVTDICFEAGYQSLGSFSAKFSSLVGRAPSEYRRELRRVFGYRAPWRIAFVPVCFFTRLSAPGLKGPQEARSAETSASPILVATRQGDAP
ncbi:MAG TPA: AraC family transcriptional regulator [Thermoanaerobaculia bacterium]